MVALFYQCALLVFVYMTFLFVIAQLKKDNSIVDIGWGFGFVLIALFTFVKSGLYLPRHLLVTLLVVMWGLRISFHILHRHKGEDFRYKAWRDEWKQWFYLRSYFQIFMLQGFFMLIISMPVIVINSSAIPGLTFVDILGAALWCLGFYFEVVGDYQLQAFITNPENKKRIMRYGLWQYTRHPNYFGEIVMWWGIWLMALTVPLGFLTIISPLTITILLVFVSGVPMLEKRFAGNPEYQEYQRTTNALIPWWPKK